jgi:hypothetical protein
MIKVLRSRGSPDHAHKRDKNAGPDKASDKIAQPPAKDDPEKRQEEVRDDSADDPEQNVHQNTHVALHEHFGEPSCDAADYDCGDPADTCVFHENSPYCVEADFDAVAARMIQRLLKSLRTILPLTPV